MNLKFWNYSNSISISFHLSFLKVRILHTKLNDAQKNVIEQEHLLESRTVALAEKTRMIEERDEKCDKLKRELFVVKREIQVSKFFNSNYFYQLFILNKWKCIYIYLFILF